MRRTTSLALSLILLFALALSTGCATRVQRYAATGGLIGAVVAAPIAYQAEGVRACCCIAVGAVTGGLVGALIGDAADEREDGDTEVRTERTSYRREGSTTREDRTTTREIERDRD